MQAERKIIGPKLPGCVMCLRVCDAAFGGTKAGTARNAGPVAIQIGGAVQWAL